MSHIDNKQELSHIEDGGKYEEGVKVDDVAADYIDASVQISPEENIRLRRKIYKHLLPAMCVAYITQSLDKGTTGAASIMGWPQDLKMKGQDYALTSTFLWVGIIIGEPIVNQFIRKFPVAKVLGISMVVWSALVLGLAFSWHPIPVFVIRALLGLFESSFGPCLVTITVQWFTAEEQTLITTFWQAMFGLAGIASNLMAYGFYHVQGANLKGWQYFTLCISIISFIASVFVLVFLPDTPMQARWATPEEKVKFVERVRKNDQGIKQKKFKHDQAKEAFLDPVSWLLVGMILLQTFVVGGLNTFNSLLIKNAFGFSTLDSLLLGIPLAFAQICMYFLLGWVGTKTKQTCLTMVGATVVNIAGTIVLLTVPPGSKTKVGLLVSFYFMQAFQAVGPSMFSMTSRNVAGQTKKSIVYAMFFVGWAGGNAVGPQFFQSKWAPRYFNSLYCHLGFYALFIIDVMVLRTVLKRRNTKRERELAGGVNRHEHAFEDRTDKENHEFRYSY